MEELDNRIHLILNLLGETLFRYLNGYNTALVYQSQIHLKIIKCFYLAANGYFSTLFLQSLHFC